MAPCRARGSRRGSLVLEPLEDRRLLSTYDFHGLTFEAAGSFNTVGNTTTASGTIELGFTPAQGSSLTPLLSLSDGVTLTDGSDSTFQGGGSLAAVIFGDPITLIQKSVVVSVDEILNKGLSTLDGSSFTVAGTTFTLDSIALANVTPGPQVQLQGSIALPGITNLELAVNGVNYVDIGPGGVSLTGIAATLSGSIDVGGLSFDVKDLTVTYQHTTQDDIFTITGDTSFDFEGQNISVDFGGTTSQGTTAGLVFKDGSLQSLDMSETGDVTVGGLAFQPEALTFDYATADSLFTMTGGANFSLEGNDVEVQFGGDSTQGLVIKGGSLQSLDMSVTASISLFGLTLAANDLTFVYDPTVPEFEMYGSLALSSASQSFGSSNGQVFDGISASLGTQAQPGLVVQKGSLQDLDITDITGSFSLLGLSMSTQDLSVDYAAASSTLEISGDVTASLAGTITATASLTNGGITINTSTGAVQVDGVKLELSDVNLGAFEIQELEVDYTQTTQGVIIGGALSLIFPEGWGVGGSFQLVNGELNDISLSYTVTSGEGIPIGDTGLFLTGMSGSVDNIEQPANLVVSGTMDVDFGPHTTIGGHSVAIFSATGSFTVDSSELEIDANLQFAGGFLGSASGSLTADWGTGVYSFSGSETFLGVFSLSGSIMFDSSYDLVMQAQISISVPSEVPLIGGLGISADFAMLYRYNGGNPTGFFAAWTSIDLIIWHPTIGFEYNLDGDLSFLDGSDVSNIKKQLENALSTSDPIATGFSTDNPFGTMFTSAGPMPAVGSSITPAGGVKSISLDLGLYSPWSQVALDVNYGYGETLYLDLSKLPVGQTELIDLSGYTIYTYHPLPYPLSNPQTYINNAGYFVVNDGNNFIAQTPDSAPILAYVTLTQTSSASGHNTVVIQAASDLGTDMLPSYAFTLGLIKSSEDYYTTIVESSTNSMIYQNPTAATPTINSDGSVSYSGSVAEGLVGSATLKFFATTDPGGTSGTLIGSSSTGGSTFAGSMSPDWSAVPPGAYYVYVVIDDGVDSPYVTPTSSSSFFPVPSLRGQVLASGLGVAGVEIDLLAPNGAFENQTTYTDSQGNYEISLPLQEPAETVTLYITPPSGYTVIGGQFWSSFLQPPGVSTTEMDFDLIPPTSIAGTVTETPESTTGVGLAAPLATLTVFIDSNHNGYLDPGEVNVVTNSLGRYVISGLAPGTYEVAFDAPDGSRLRTPRSHVVQVAYEHQQVTAIDFALVRQYAAPTSKVLSPGPAPSAHTWYGSIVGTAADTDGYQYLSEVLITVRDQTTGLYWDGHAFSARASVPLEARGTSNWSLPMPSSALTGGHTYLVTSTAHGVAGTAQDTPSTLSFNYAAPAPPTPTQPVATTTAIACSTSVSTPGQPVYVTISVAAAGGAGIVPSGSVALLDGPTVLATLPLSAGRASFQISTLSVGTHTLTAVYLGDSRTSASASPPTVETVRAPGPAELVVSTVVPRESVTLVGLRHGRLVRVLLRDRRGRLLARPVVYATNALSRITLDLERNDRVRLVGPIRLPVWAHFPSVERLIHAPRASLAAKDLRGTR